MPPVPLSVRVIGWTHFEPPGDVPWSTDADGGQALAEFAGRACYQSWGKPNPVTATNAGYLAHILDVGHLSVLEHGTVTMYLTGVSRSLTHELVRHRHFSYSQLSQRYVPEDDAGMVVPDVIAGDPDLCAAFAEATDVALAAYRGLVAELYAKATARATAEGHPATQLPGAVGPVCPLCLMAYPCPPVVAAGTAARKAARQAARSVLPNATETRIVVTGNYRAWRHFVALRATEHADVEIRALAVQCLRLLQQVAPNVFADFVTSELPDGTSVAYSPHTEHG